MLAIGSSIGAPTLTSRCCRPRQSYLPMRPPQALRRQWRCVLGSDGRTAEGPTEPSNCSMQSFERWASASAGTDAPGSDPRLGRLLQLLHEARRFASRHGAHGNLDSHLEEKTSSEAPLTVGAAMAAPQLPV